MLRSIVALGMLVAFMPLPGASASSAVQTATPTPFTALLELNAARAAAHGGGEQASYPIWLESVEFPPASGRTSTVRLRLRALPGLSDRILLRLFFFDRAGSAQGPSVSGWSETGEQLYSSGPLGVGLGLAASESLAIETDGINYLEITVPDDPTGIVLRQALIASLKPTERLEALDFSSIASLADPFAVESEVYGESSSDADHSDAPLPASLPPESDTFLFGRTRATLHASPVRLTPESEASSTAHFTFTLGTPPLLGMASFLLHHADPAAPLLAWINGQPVGTISMQLPDLADPGYIASAQGYAAPRFRYAGWVRAQIAFPGELLRKGTNTLSLQLPGEAAPVVLHRLELQLKGHWHKLDYTTRLAP